MPKTPSSPAPKPLTDKESAELLATLKARFSKHMARHEGLVWDDVQRRLEAKPKALAALHAMESTGGEPDVVGCPKGSAPYLFMDCAAESPKGRRSVCYDPEALASRKEHKPKHSALGLAADLGIELLTEADYRDLQKIGPFDEKTSSWLATPPEIRKRGGAIFGDYRYGQVFIYHNGAESYYAARGFRGVLRV